MILSRYDLIYLHVPKTSGNSLSLLLLDHSDDHKIIKPRQDGYNRFNILGPVTTGKHMVLAKYRDAIGDEALARYRIAISVRDPLDRAISWYFSPHRWLVQEGDAIVEVPVEYSFDRFVEDVSRIKSLADFLTIDGEVRTPDFLIRFDSVEQDVARLVAVTGLPIDIGARARVNVSPAPPKLIADVRADPRVRRFVAEHFAKDYRILGYEPDIF